MEWKLLNKSRHHCGPKIKEAENANYWEWSNWTATISTMAGKIIRIAQKVLLFLLPSAQTKPIIKNCNLITRQQRNAATAIVWEKESEKKPNQQTFIVSLTNNNGNNTAKWFGGQITLPVERRQTKHTYLVLNFSILYKTVHCLMSQVAATFIAIPSFRRSFPRSLQSHWN